MAAFTGASAGAAPLRSIEEIRSVAEWDLRQAHPIQLTGTLTHIDQERRSIVIQPPGGQALALRMDPADAGNVSIPRGHTVSLEAKDSWPEREALPDFPLNPSLRELLPQAKVPAERGVNYVSRLRGYLHPPTTGEYRFWIASDDTSELWLGTDGDPRSVRRVAAATSWTKPDEWTRVPAQKSAPIRLEAGRHYYIEAIHEQTLGTDHLSVAWQGPGFPQQVIDGAYLSPWRPASDEPHAGPDERSSRGSILRECWLERTVESAAHLNAPRKLQSKLVVVGATLRDLGPGTFPDAQRVQPGQRCESIDDYRWCEIEGNVEFVAYQGDSLVLELTDGAPRTRVVIDDAPRSWTQRFHGRRIRVHGIAEPATDAAGNRTVGTVRTLPGNPPTIVERWPQLNNYRAATIVEVLSIDPQLFRNRAVKVRGRVTQSTEDGELTLGDRGAFHAYVSSDGMEWRQIGMPVEVAMNESARAGLMLSSRSAEKPVTADFDSLAGFGGKLEATSIGSPTNMGSFVSQGDGYTVTASGRDAWLPPDHFYFLHAPFDGTGEVVVRVGNLSPNPPEHWAKAGLMIRESLAPDAPFADLVKTGGGGVHFQWRNNGEGEGPRSAFDSTLTGPQWLKLARRFNTIRVSTAHGGRFETGQELEVIGYVNSDGAQLAITDASCREVSGGDARPAPTVSPEARPLVELSRIRNAAGYTNLYNMLKVRGVVTFAGEVAGRRYVTVQDHTGAAFVADPFIPERSRYRAGHLVEIHSNPSWFAPSRDLNASNIFVLGEGVLPKPLHHPAEYSLPHRGEAAWLELEGIVRSASRDGLLEMRHNGEVFTVAIAGMPKEQLEGFVDAMLRVRGALAYPTDRERLLLVPSEAHVEVVETAPQQPLNLPVQAIGEFSPVRLSGQSVHRAKVKGVVTWAGRDAFYLQDETGGARVEMAEAAPPKIGDVVEAVGFPDVEQDRSCALSNALVRTVAAARPPAPVEVTAARILSGRQGARLVRVKAILSRDRVVDGDHTLELQLEQRIFRATLNAASLPSIPPGSLVEVTGVCVLESELPEWIKVSAGPSSILPVRLLLRSPADLVVLQKPRWWAVKRTLVFVGITLAGLFVVVAWIQILRRRVAQRTAELQNAMEKLRHETQAAATLAERNRLAGEIHDSLEQGFSGLILQLDTTAKLGGCPPDVRSGLTLARNMVAFSRNEVRHAVWDLHSPVLQNADLGTALKNVVDQLAPETVQTTIAVEGVVRPLSSALEHHLLRIAQEAITNCIKHAGAAHLDIVLTFGDAEISLLVRDDGRGFVPEEVLTGGLGHFGLRSLRGRAGKIQGKLKVTSKPGEGTTVEVRVPATPPGSTASPFHANDKNHA